MHILSNVFHSRIILYIFFLFTFFCGCVRDSTIAPNQNAENLSSSAVFDSPPINVNVTVPAIRYFNRTVLEEIVNDPSLSYEDIIFSEEQLSGLKRYAGEIFPSSSGLICNYIEYENYNILLLTERLNAIQYLRDLLVLEKENQETFLANGAVEINSEYFDWEVIVVVNSWHDRRFTDDISQAFKVNLETKKIEPFFYDTIRLYNEEWG